MKSKIILLFCFLGVIILSGILIGTGTIQLNLYTSELKNDVQIKGNNTSSFFCLNNSKDKSTPPPNAFIVAYKDKVLGDIHALNPVRIDLSDKDLGKIQFSLFRKSDYSFLVSYDQVYNSETTTSVSKSRIRGDIYVSGHYKIIGFCSSNTARSLIVDKLMKDIYTNIKK